jgi:hypothetical protein
MLCCKWCRVILFCKCGRHSILWIVLLFYGMNTTCCVKCFLILRCNSGCLVLVWNNLRTYWMARHYTFYRSFCLIIEKTSYSTKLRILHVNGKYTHTHARTRTHAHKRTHAHAHMHAHTHTRARARAEMVNDVSVTASLDLSSDRLIQSTSSKPIFKYHL